MPVAGMENKVASEYSFASTVCEFFKLAIPTYISNFCSEAFTLIVIIFAGQFDNADMIAGVGLASTTSFILCYGILFGCNKPIETFTS